MAEIMGGKSCVLDVRAKMPSGEMVNVEVQIRDQKNIDRRSLFYLSKEYVRQLNAGGDYILLPDVIAINIVNYDYPKTQSFHSCFHLREDTEHEIILTEALEIHFVNMVKYRELVREGSFKHGLKDPLFRWLTWLDKSSPLELLEEVVKMDSSIKTADKRLFHVTQSEEDMIAYDRYLIAECDRISELNEGIRRQNKYIIDLINQGLTTEEIKQRLEQEENN